ncbi:MAG: PAS domain-containing protein [Faecalibacterium sp.]|nr:PAS domain-containing protein [Faecalibacterium sp.]
MNDTYYHLIGYTREEYAALHQSPIEALIYPEDIALLPSQQEELERCGHMEAEYRIVRKDGQIRWIKLDSSKMLLDNELVVFNTFLDITNEKTLSAQFDLIADHVENSISILRIEAGKETPIYTNDAFYKMLGISREEYLRDPMGCNQRMVLGKERALVENKVREAFVSGKSGSVQYWLHRADGTSIYVNRDFSVVRQEGNGAYLMLSISSDITAQKQAGDLLEKERSRYRLALEQTHATIFEWDYQTGAFYCSESYHKYVMSQTENEKIVHNKGRTDAVHPDDLLTLKQFFAAEGDPNAKHECILRLKMTDGSYRWSRMSGQQTRDEKGKPLSAIGVIMDINDEMEKSLMMNQLVTMLPCGVGIFKVAAKVQCLYFNQKMIDLGGRSDAEIQEIFSKANFAEDVIFPEDRELFQAEVMEKARLGQRINCNFRYKRNGDPASKEVGWIHFSAVKIREEDGCPVYYAVLAEPSNESKIFKQISERSLVAELAIEYPSGKILYANRAFCALTDMPDSNALVGCGCADILSESDAAGLLGIMQDSIQKESVEAASWTSCGKYLHIQAHPINWNGKEAFMFYFSDQTETQLYNERLATIINSVPSGIGIYEIQDGKVVQLYLNDAFHRMLHDTRENRQKYAGENYLKAIHPDDAPAFQKAMEGLLQGEKVIELTYRVINGDGAWIWLRIDGNLEVGAEGRKIVYCSYFDVNEQMKTQLALKQEQTVLKLAMQTAKMSSWEYAIAEKCIYQSEESRAQHGFDKKIENVPEALIQAGYVHPDSVEEYRRLFSPAADENDIKRADVYIKTADRQDYWWERVILTPIFDVRGAHLYSIGTTIDITEQKNAEQKYRRQMQELSSADSPDLIAKGLYNLTKNRVESYHARTEDAVSEARVSSYDAGLQETARRFFKKDEGQKFLTMFGRRALMQDLRKGETELSLEYQRKAKDGTLFWARTQAKLSTDPNGEDVLCFIYTYDIDEHKIAQETIQTVIKLDYDYFAVLDCRANNHILYSGNEDGTTLLPPLRSTDYEQTVREYSEKNLKGEDVARSIHDMSIANIREQLKTQDSFVSCVNMCEADGSIRRKKMQFSYLDRENEQVLITRMDITDIYEQEQKRLTELRDAAQAVQQANGIKTDFLARMSHDLRTPMNAVIGLTELAKDELSNPQAMEYYISSIHSAGKFLLGLVNDCLDLEKMSANRMELHPGPYTYPAFRQSVTTIIGPLCQAKKIAFFFADNTTPYTVQMDAVRFEQIFINLLTNAVKFTPEGGKVEFLICHNVRRGEILSCDFVVRDNGIGMSEDFQKRMFEPFEQESNEITPQSQGTGLGLSIVKNLLELMHGTISVKSEKGKGTEFTVHLDMPILDTTEGGLPKAPAGDTTVLKDKHILLVEDHPLNTEIAKKLLQKKGMVVTCACNGQAALEAFAQSRQGTFDAILMDVRMPVMDGLEATRAIRALARADAQNVPIVAMTANAFEEDVQATKKAGMNEHLSKPIEPDLLYQTLAAWMHKPL